MILERILNLCHLHDSVISVNNLSIEMDGCG